MFDFIKSLVIFALLEVALIFGLMMLHKYKSENYVTAFEEPPFILRSRYLIAIFISLTFALFTEVLSSLAMLGHQYGSIPWFGNGAVLFMAWLALTVCAFGLAYITDDNR